MPSFYVKAYQQILQLFSANMLKAGAGFIGSIFVLRGWATEDIGDIYTLVGVMLMFNQFGDLGTGSSFIQLVSRSKGENQNIIDAYLGYKILVSSILFILFVIFTYIYFFQSSSREVLGLSMVALAAVFGVLGGFFTTLITSRQQIKKLSILKVVPPVVKTIIRISLCYTGQKDFVWLLFAFLCPPLILVILGYFLTGYPFYRARIRSIFTKRGRQLYNLSKWVFFIGFAHTAFSQIDIFMLKRMSSDYQIAQFVSAQKLAAIVVLLSQAIFTVMLPKMNSIKDARELISLNKKIFYLFVALNTLMIPVTYLVPWVVPIVMGQKYLASIPILKVFLFQALGYLFISTQSLFFCNCNRLPILVLFSLTQLLLNGLGNYLVIYEYKALGAVSVSALLNGSTYLIMSIYCYFLLRKDLK